MFLARVLFYPTLGYNVAMAKVSSRNWYDHVDETVILGALPFKNVAEKLIHEEGIKAVLSVNEDYELKMFTYSEKEYADRGVEQLRLNAVDLTGTISQDKLTQGVDFILSHRCRGDRVYVHCKAGRTRSATLTMCYLMKAHGFSPQKSFENLKLCRQHIWLRKKQWDSVRRFYREMGAT